MGYGVEPRAIEISSGAAANTFDAPTFDELDALIDVAPDQALDQIQRELNTNRVPSPGLLALEARALAFLAFPQRARRKLDVARSLATAEQDEVAILVSECSIRMVEGDAPGALAEVKAGIQKHPGQAGIPLRRTLSWINSSLTHYEDVLVDTPESVALAQRYGDVRAVLALRINEAVALLELGRMEEARHGFLYVLALAEQHDHDELQLAAAHNLAVISARLGDVRLALDQFAETRKLVTAKDQLAFSSLDEAETLMEVGLFEEAWQTGRRAEHAARSISNQMSVVKAVDLQTRASAATGRWRRAYQEANTLKEDLARLASASSPRVATYLRRVDAVQTLAKARFDPAALAEDLGGDPTDLLTSGDPRLAVELADIFDSAGHEDLALRLLAEATKNPTTRHSPLEAVYASIARALLARRQQSSSFENDALNAVDAALDFLDLLPSTETRHEVDRAMQHVVPILVETYVDRNELNRLQLLLEHVHMRSQSIEGTVSDEELTLLQHLRETTRVLQRLDESSEQSVGFIHRQIEIQRRLRELRRSAERSAVGPLVEESDLAMNLCYLTLSGDSLYGVVKRPGSEHELVAIDEARNLIREIGAFRAALDNHAFQRPTHDWRELRDTIARRLGPLTESFAGVGTLVVPDRSLPLIPWPAVSPTPVSLIPMRAILRAGTPSPQIEQVLAVAGPGLDLADREIEALGAIYGDRLVSFPSDRSTVNEVLAATETASLVHLACHGSMRTNHVLLSSLHLHDGPLTMFDLLRDGFPPYAILAACNVGRSLSDAGTALAATLLSRGCRAFVASVGAISDEEAFNAMVTIHDGLGAGGDFLETVHSSLHRLIDEAPSLGNLFLCGAG